MNVELVPSYIIGCAILFAATCVLFFCLRARRESVGTIGSERISPLMKQYAEGTLGCVVTLATEPLLSLPLTEVAVAFFGIISCVTVIEAFRLSQRHDRC